MLSLNVLEEKILLTAPPITGPKKRENDTVLWASPLARPTTWGGDMAFCSDGLAGVLDVGDLDSQ